MTSDDLTHKSFNCSSPTGDAATISVTRDIQTTSSGSSNQVGLSITISNGSTTTTPVSGNNPVAPGAPTAFPVTATVQPSTSQIVINLTWNAPGITGSTSGPTEIVGYLIEKTTDDPLSTDARWTPIANLGWSTTSYQDKIPVLSTSIQYWYKLSTVFPARTDTSSPTGLTAVESSRAITLKWNDSSTMYPSTDGSYNQIIGYSIERLSSNRWSVISNVYSGDDSYVDSDSSSLIGTGQDPSYRVSTIIADIQSACEYLAISPAEEEALTDDTTAGKWLGDIELADHTIPVQTFLDKAYLVYTDLLSLVKTNFINPYKIIEISLDPDDPLSTNLTKRKILRIDTIDGGKIPRFIRLWHKLGWQLVDLDKVITALCPDPTSRDITDPLLVNLAVVSQIQSTLKLSLLQVCAFFATTIDAQGDNSLYSQIFLNPTIKNPPDPSFELNSDQSALQVEEPSPSNPNPTPEPLNNHGANIVSALGITSDDLTTMTVIDKSLDDPIIQSLQVLGNSLTPINLSKLYRIATLSHALNLSIKDLFSLIQLTHVNPFDQVDNNNSLRDVSSLQHFIMLAQEVRQSGFSIDELGYLIKDMYQGSGEGVRPIEQDVAAFFGDLVTKLQKSSQQSSSILDPDGQILRKNLPLVLTPDKNIDFQDSINVNN